MYKAFQGANGWYVAWENQAGFHRQSIVTIGSEHAARLVARERQRQEELNERYRVGKALPEELAK